MSRGDEVAPDIRPEEIEALRGQQFKFEEEGAPVVASANEEIARAEPETTYSGRIHLPDLGYAIGKPAQERAAWALRKLYGRNGYPATANDGWLARRVNERLEEPDVPEEYRNKTVNRRTIGRLLRPD
jgi:hypothetical protein